MTTFNDLEIKIFADGANLDQIPKINKLNYIKGYTTNPSLMKNAGVTDYKEFAFKFMDLVGDAPVSFEVFADDVENMERQAIEISSWSKNIIIKIPITNSKGVSTKYLIKKLTDKNIACNITAIFTLKQILNILDFINKDTYCILSIFAGRIADTGIDPMPIFKDVKKIVESFNNIELLWASPRELLNIFQAEKSGCHIITAASDILNKIKLIDKNLDDYSLETVQMFYNDSLKAGYKL